jgi:hypothetical protein
MILDFVTNEDYEDRFQWVDGYVQNGVMNRTKRNPGTDANKITKSRSNSCSHSLYG